MVNRPPFHDERYTSPLDDLDYCELPENLCLAVRNTTFVYPSLACFTIVKVIADFPFRNDSSHGFPMRWNGEGRGRRWINTRIVMASSPPEIAYSPITAGIGFTSLLTNMSKYVFHTAL